MKRLLVVFCWICVIAVGAFLRFDDLSKRPFHADEATGARITASRMAGEGKFDPKHYHGPLFHMIAATVCRVKGENTWSRMEKGTLRSITATAGCLLLLAPLGWRRRFGDLPVLVAAAFLATSPLLVYYSRMFIHEILLTLAGVLALAAICGKPRLVSAGILLGVMFAVKETFAISVIAWSAAGVWIWWRNRRELGISRVREWLGGHWKGLLMGGLSALAGSMLVYTDFLRHPAGAIDAVKTFFVYETVGGHEKPFSYYLDLLAVPRKTSGLWWFGTPLVLLGCLGVLLPQKDRVRRDVAVFVGLSTIGHVVIYSLIGYKTPWLMCLPVAQICLLAGFGFAGFRDRGRWLQLGLVLLATTCLVSQFVQARRAAGRFASDERNPYAYVPSHGDLEEIRSWLFKLGGMKGGGSLEPVAVIGSDYWPLPWYLRSFEKVGYWKDLPERAAGMPVVFAMPESASTVGLALADSHMQFPYGLRAGVPVILFLRNDIADRWNKEGGQ